MVVLFGPQPTDGMYNRLQSKLYAVICMAVCVLVLSLWDTVKLHTWERTTGTIISYQHGYYKGSHYYQPVIEFSVDDRSTYTFVSRRKDTAATHVGASVEVLYHNARGDPTQHADLVERLQREASHLMVLSLVILGGAALVLLVRTIALQHRETDRQEQQQLDDERVGAPPYESMDGRDRGLA